MNKLTKKLTPSQLKIINELNRLIELNDKKTKRKAALYAASEAFLNKLK